MTAMLSRDGTNFNLACDRCGQLVANLADTLHHWDFAWATLRRHGWTGTALATGPHTCPPCVRSPNPAAVAEQAPGRAWSDPAGRRPHRLTVTELPGVMLVEARGELTLPATMALHEVLLSEHRPRRHVVVDLSGASTLGAGALQLLVRTQAHTERYGLELCLTGLSDQMRESLRLLCLTHLLPAFTERADALAWLSLPAADRSAPSRAHSPADPAMELA